MNRGNGRLDQKKKKKKIEKKKKKKGKCTNGIRLSHFIVLIVILFAVQPSNRLEI